jgi:hypothetical protein
VEEQEQPLSVSTCVEGHAADSDAAGGRDPATEKGRSVPARRHRQRTRLAHQMAVRLVATQRRKTWRRKLRVLLLLLLLLGALAGSAPVVWSRHPESLTEHLVLPERLWSTYWGSDNNVP